MRVDAAWTSRIPVIPSDFMAASVRLSGRQRSPSTCSISETKRSAIIVPSTPETPDSLANGTTAQTRSVSYGALSTVGCLSLDWQPNIGANSGTSAKRTTRIRALLRRAVRDPMVGISAAIAVPVHLSAESPVHRQGSREVQPPDFSSSAPASLPARRSSGVASDSACPAAAAVCEATGFDLPSTRSLACARFLAANSTEPAAF